MGKLLCSVYLVYKFVARHSRFFFFLGTFLTAALFIALGIGKTYQNWDDDKDRGAIPIAKGEWGENFTTPTYLDQGWDEADSLWFYNVTQGSALLPYDFFMVLEQADNQTLFRDNQVFDKYRYLPQKPTFFNPDGLAVGFVKDTYKGNNYVGYTCAACHTSQVNYGEHAIRIDGGPAMADMVGYLYALQKALQATLTQPDKQQRFVKAVLARGEYNSSDKVLADLEKWTKLRINYNLVNHSNLDYGYARLDAFGRIFNRVLQHVINKRQARNLMLMTTRPNGSRILTTAQVDLVLDGINETIIGNEQFSLVVDRLTSSDPGYPNLNARDMFRIRNALFNEPNAPVSYPFLWDITHSDYVQWNGIGDNSGVGPLGRNAGEVTGVFAILDWKMSTDKFNLGAMISGQKNKSHKINFSSSIDLINLQRIENHLRSLQSPVWPEEILGKINTERASRGEIIYAQYCQSCHEIIDRKDWNRIVVAQMSSLNEVGTDPRMAKNSVEYKGKAGNFKYTYQATGVGNMIMGEEAPAAAILTATTRGVVGTPDADKNIFRRWLDWMYTLGASFFQNEIKPNIKQGTYPPDTTASPFQSLLAYKARSLNGIWATAPFLHNGSVPSLYDVLLPVKREGDPDDGEYRPESFMVGSREFDPIKVGFKTEGYDGFRYLTTLSGNTNVGHEYAGGHTPQPNGEVLPALNKEQRLDLLEFLKTL